MHISPGLFDDWNAEKKALVFSGSKKFMPIHHRDIWYVKLGINIGCEEHGKKDFRRPVLVLKKVGSLYFCVPLTTKGKVDSKRYHSISSIDFGKPSSILLSQARVLDLSRFISKIAKISPEEFILIKEKVAKLYGYL